MRLLLDTHILLWWLVGDDRLTRQVRDAIEDPETTVYVSAASAWEISIKTARGKLDLPGDLSTQLVEEGFDELAVTIQDGLDAGALPRLHDDPFDRMLVAQAMSRGLRLVSADRLVLAYRDVPLLPCL